MSGPDPLPPQPRTRRRPFARQSSGLVRDISPSVERDPEHLVRLDPARGARRDPGACRIPGASPFWATVICAVLCIAPVMLYSLFMAVMPRSGGDYVFMSRTLHPWAGFAANFNITAWYLLVIAYFGYLLTPFGLSSAFTTIGVAADSDTLTSWGADVAGSKGWQFAIGAVALILTRGDDEPRPAPHAQAPARDLLPVPGRRRRDLVLLLLIHGRGRLRAAASPASAATTARSSSDAARPRASPAAAFDLGNTLLAMPLAFASFGYAIVTSYAGGEVRSPNGSGRYGDAAVAGDLRRRGRAPDGPRLAHVRQRLPRLGDRRSRTPAPRPTRSARRRSSSSSCRC